MNDSFYVLTVIGRSVFKAFSFLWISHFPKPLSFFVHIGTILTMPYKTCDNLYQCVLSGILETPAEQLYGHPKSHTVIDVEGKGHP